MKISRAAAAAADIRWPSVVLMRRDCRDSGIALISSLL
jgi:hypothetical protein